MPSIFGRGKEPSGRLSPGVNRTDDDTRPRRYLVVGSEGHGVGVVSHRWDKMPNDLNVADYDVVILNFAAFEDADLAAGFPRDRLPALETMSRLIFSPNAEVIAIGNPSTLIGPPPTETKWFDSRARADYWLPFYIGVEDDVGRQYRVDAQEWASYFENVSGWRWIATGEAEANYQAVDYMKPVTNKAEAIQLALEPIATTRYEKMIALRVHLHALRFTRYLDDGGYGGIARPDPASRELVVEASPVVWLPAPDDVTVEDAIDIILRERYGIAQKARVPDWAAAYTLPDEAPIAGEIARLEQERREVEERISEARGRAVAAGSPRSLLYEKGKDVLEPIVRDTLHALGARVEDPEQPGVEDGKLSHDDGRAVLEIKGRSGPIKQDDIRQVVQWASDAKLKDGVEYKPPIIGNPHNDQPPDERGESLAPNAATYARNGGVAVVTTLQIFEALRQKQAGTFDEARFWKTIFATSGAANLDAPAAGDATVARESASAEGEHPQAT